MLVLFFVAVKVAVCLFASQEDLIKLKEDINKAREDNSKLKKELQKQENFSEQKDISLELLQVLVCCL